MREAYELAGRDGNTRACASLASSFLTHVPLAQAHDAVSLHGPDAYLARLRSQTYIDLYLSALHAERMRLADFSQQTRGGAK